MRLPSSGSMRPGARPQFGAASASAPDRLERFLAEATRRNRGRRPRWAHLVDALRNGPKTTGELGYIRGIGENVRGIRREADRNLTRIGFHIEGEETEQRDAAGDPISNATYRLVDDRLQPHLDRSAADVQRRKEQLGLGV